MIHGQKIGDGPLGPIRFLLTKRPRKPEDTNSSQEAGGYIHKKGSWIDEKLPF